MRTLPAGLTTELASRAFSVCRAVQITRKDGTVKRFVESQSDLTINGNLYVKMRGIRMSSIPYVLNASQMTVDFEATAVDDATIDPDDLRNGLYDNAAVIITAVSQATPSTNFIALFRGQIGETEITDRGLAKFEVMGLLSKAREIPIEHYVPLCLAFFGDERCRVDLGPITLATTVSSVSSDGWTVTLAATPPAHMRLGVIRVVGVDEGFEIRGVSGNTLTLFLPCIGKIVASDSVEVTPGCDFTYDGSQGCVFWNNEINFLGFRDVPGADVLSINFTDWGS